MVNNTIILKICSGCGTIWEKRDDFLKDPNVVLKGYQADFESLEEGLFYFNHLKSDCLSTIALEVTDFLDLYKGSRYQERKTGTEECPGLCLELDKLDRCEAMCECAYVRELMEQIKNF